MTLLTAHILNGQVVGTELTQYSVIKVPFKIESTPSLGYIDISSVKNWWDFGMDLNQDYLYVRRAIKLLVEQKGIDDCISTISDPPANPINGDQYYIDPNSTATGDWVGYEGWCAIWNDTNNVWVKQPAEWVGYRVCNTSEKDICAQLKIGSQLDHFADYGVPEIYNLGVEYHKKAVETRINRMLRVEALVYNYLPLYNAQVLINIIANPLGDLSNLYKSYGIKGTLEDYNKDFNPSPTPGICDYILGRAPFNNQEPYISAGYPKGLILENWVSIDNQTMPELSMTIYSLLVHGNTDNI